MTTSESVADLLARMTGLGGPELDAAVASIRQAVLSEEPLQRAVCALWSQARGRSDLLERMLVDDLVRATSGDWFLVPEHLEMLEQERRRYRGEAR